MPQGCTLALCWPRWRVRLIPQSPNPPLPTLLPGQGKFCLPWVREWEEEQRCMVQGVSPQAGQFCVPQAGDLEPFEAQLHAW